MVEGSEHWIDRERCGTIALPIQGLIGHGRLGMFQVVSRSHFYFRSGRGDPRNLSVGEKTHPCQFSGNLNTAEIVNTRNFIFKVALFEVTIIYTMIRWRENAEPC